MKNNSLLLLLFLCLFLSTNILAVPGDFDTSFNMTGKRRTAFGFGYDGANGLVRLPDGKFIAAGYAQVGTNTEFAIARFTADGALDTTFGDGGKVTTDIGSGGDSAESVAVQTDGKIVVVGSAGNGNGPIAGGSLGGNLGISDIAIVRYNADGTLDTSFGAGGKIVIDSGFGNDFAMDVAIQPDGNIIVVGGIATADHDYDFYVARFLANGSPDAAFGTNGYTSFDFSGFNRNSANAVALQADGKIVAAGNSGNFFTSIAVARLNTDGSLDMTFSGDGKVLTEFGKSSGIANDVAIQTDGKIVVAGHQGFFANQSFVTFRYMTDGALDTTFDSDGRVDTNFGTASYGQAVAIQADGKIVVAGLTGGSGIDDFALARYNADGSPDTSFDTDGILLTDFGAKSIDGANALVIQPDGGIVAAGYGVATDRTDGDFALARYTTTGALDTTFDADGKTTADIGSGRSAAQAVVVQPDGKIIAAGYSENGDETRDFALVRYTVSGGLDQTFGSGGKLVTDFRNDDAAYALALQPDGKIIAAGISSIKGDEVFALARYTSEGALDTTFGEGGKLRLLIGDFNGASSVAVQPDGNIIVAGYTSVKGQYNFLVARLTATGELDTTFDGDGYAETDFNGFDDRVNGISLQSDGKIVAAGSSYSGANNDFAVARYNTDGSLDTTFDTDGKTTTDFNGNNDDGNAVAIQYDGKIVVAGQAGALILPGSKAVKAGKAQLGGGNDTDFGLVRYTTTGALDETFDTDGKITTDFAGGRDSANSIVIQPGGRILAAGYASTGFTEVSPSGTNTGFDFGLARYEMQTGALDTSFGTGGKQMQDITGTEDIAYAVKLDPFGNIVVAGVSDALFTVARLFNNIAPNAAAVSVSGRVMSNRGSSISRAVVTMTDSRGNIKRYVTGAFGFYRFTGVIVGETYIVNISSKRYRFDPQVLNITEDVEELNFTPSY
ncbi:MAG: hypothetical protein ABWZ66_06035 [Pyrinomonadaceae bacterium]